MKLLARKVKLEEIFRMRLHEELNKLIGKPNKQASVAERLNVRPSQVSQWLSGTETCPPHHLARIVEYYRGGDEMGKRTELGRLFILLLREQLGTKWADVETKNLKDQSLEYLLSATDTSTYVVKQTGRTLADFPSSFYPMVVVSGDKREVSETCINAADFGVVSASPAESRWILKLDLRRDVEFYGDKIFVLASEEELKERFGKKNLLVLGSPASNHLSRRLLLAKPPLEWPRPAVPIFRFNLDQQILQQIEGFLSGIVSFNARQLVGKQGDPDTEREMKHWLHSLFAGGIIDPSYRDLWLRGCGLPPARDYGLISFARNPFADDDEHVCILAAGFHMFGTAMAIEKLSNTEFFNDHPFGGVIRVNINLDLSFHARFDDARAEWDEGSAYSKDVLVAGLKTLRESIPTRVSITRTEVDDCLSFIDAL